MTVSTEVDHNDYTGNGVTTSFPYTFRIFNKTDLMVQVVDLNESITVLTLDTDYSVTGAGTYSGGSVVLPSPLANGWQISISRELPATQETDLRNQGKFFAEVHEDAFDKLTMLIQQCFSFLRLALRKPSFIANYYDALNNRIRNLRDPSQEQDAATKHYVDDSVAGSMSHADDLFNRTLRVPEGGVNQLYPITGRRNSLLGFDSNGDPIPVFSMTDTADLAIKLASHEKSLGASLVGVVNVGTVSDAINYITPEMYGAVGDGVNDDYQSIQNMFNDSAEGCNFVFDGRKTYYNAFSSGSWTITKPCTVNFNGAKLTRRTPAGAADNQTAVILVSGAHDVNLLNVNIDGNNPIGYPYRSDGTQATSGNKTALCQSIDYGVYLLSSTSVVITGKIQKCAFNIWAKSSSDFKVKGVLNYGGQVVPNVTSSDLAYGAGIKLSDCTDFDIDVSGKGNANATVEVEPNANNGRVVQRSANNLSSGLTITNSYGIIFDSYTNDSSIGTQITQNSTYTVDRIIGRSVSTSCGWGLLLNLQSSATTNMKNISVEAISTNCRSYGLYIFNQSATKSMNYDIRYTGDGNYTNGAGTSGNDIVVTGNCQGRVSGSSSGCYNTFLVSGTQLPDYPPKFDLDVKGAITVDYFISPGSYADISGTKTKTTHIVSAGSNFTKLHMYKLGSGAAQSTLTDWMVKTDHAYYLPMPTSYSFNNSLYAVLDSGSTNTYTVKVRL